jgi:hypothetical protein
MLKKRKKSADSVLLVDLSAATQAALLALDPGSLIYRIECGENSRVPVLGWLAIKSAQFQIPKENKDFIQNIINQALKLNEKQ